MPMASNGVKNKYRLNPAKYQELKKLQQQVNETRAYLVSCKNCNLDVESELAKTDEQLESIKNMLIEFAPKN